ncbi:AraC family transcriptional regulator [Hydrogenophaga crassostreae]|uniref:AraC family transcriptional regulator n=1 Tax=Hydrogenophaga crassostreae TaxID=1763535 RepID=A0A163CP64_9BURK|nr:helix-turn-helix domain-containing protein [Hydrogenophaga crassostreae]AOW14046.1 AraC family transcriptional regulator [Hydrogenophaga crassostreae]OAD43991.1 AraC family transcriptional regulator [Hydrogenophaga crassostreae]
MDTQLGSQPPLGPIHVHFVLLSGSLILDWAGPAEALRMANQRLRDASQPEAFALHFTGPQFEVASSVGAVISAIAPLPAELPERSWVVLVGQPGATIAVDTGETQSLLHWLRGLRLQTGQLELVTVCAGAVLAGHAGLLHGHRATTHHHHLDELRRVAGGCDVVENRVFVLDGAVSSSAGVTTGVDLFLHRIAAVCGPALAAQVAQSMVVALRRGPNDPELSPFLAHRNHLHPALHRVQDAVGQHPQANWSVARMAEVACASPRHLTRLFLIHAAIAPLQYLRRIRLDVAQAALRSGHNVTQAAHIAGFTSDTQLRRTWHQMGRPGTPSDAA